MTDERHRVVLRGGTVIDGLGAPSRRADVEIVDGRVGAIGTIDPSLPRDVDVDATGRLVLPGLIDAHSHADGAVFDPEVQLALLRQGITTIIGGQDGVSYAPGDGVWASEYFGAINGPHPRFSGGSVADLLGTYDGATPLNVGYLVPAGTVRHAVIGMSADPATPEHLQTMRAMVAEGMAQGALGLSTGLDYVPGLYARAAEIAALCEPVAAAGGLYVTHMRGGYESNTATGLAEVAEICRRSGVNGHVSHLHVDADDAQRLLAEVAASGVELTFDMYPYTRGCTLVSMALLPPEYSALPVDDAMHRLADPAVRAVLKREWFPTIADKPSLGPDWPTMVRVGHAPRWGWAPGLTITEISAHRGTSAEDATIDLLIENRMEVNAVMAVRDERSDENLGRVFALEGHTGGSDGIFIGAVPHPRAAGTFARYLGAFAGDRLPWEVMVRHLSGRTAERFGLADRGVLRTGAIADVIIVDPAVADAATYDSPRAPAIGIDDVFVAGVRVLEHGNLTGARPGRGLRRTARSH